MTTNIPAICLVAVLLACDFTIILMWIFELFKMRWNGMHLVVLDLKLYPKEPVND